MNQQKSQFGKELAIIPPIANVLGVIAFFLVQIGMLVIVPRYCHDLPPMPWWYLISFIGGFFLAVIIMMVGYVNADSKRRGMNSLLWTLLVIFIPKALGFIAYFLLRKPLLVPCPNCQSAVGSDFRYCPKCGYAVTPVCSHCGRRLERDYIVCPQCGKKVEGQSKA